MILLYTVTTVLFYSITVLQTSDCQCLFCSFFLQCLLFPGHRPTDTPLNCSVPFVHPVEYTKDQFRKSPPLSVSSWSSSKWQKMLQTKQSSSGHQSSIWQTGTNQFLFSPTRPSGPSWSVSRDVCIFIYIFICPLPMRFFSRPLIGPQIT